MTLEELVIYQAKKIAILEQELEHESNMKDFWMKEHEEIANKDNREEITETRKIVVDGQEFDVKGRGLEVSPEDISIKK